MTPSTTGRVPFQLLAKQRSARAGLLSLERHLSETDDAARAIFAPSRRATRNYLRFFRLDPDADGEIFQRSLRVAALFHDIGKANAHFYELVTGGSTEVQALRHEHLSALVLCLPEVRNWLGRARDLSYSAICGAVLSHHLKAAKPGQSWAWGHPKRDVRVPLYLQHPEVQRTLERVAQVVGCGDPPVLPWTSWKADDPQWQQVLRAGVREADLTALRWMRAETDAGSRRDRQLGLAVKAALIAADSVASASFREGLSIAEWVSATLHCDSLTPAVVQQDVIDERTASILVAKGRAGEAFSWHNFQIGAGEQPERTLLLAGCGAGKTLAAWRWIANQCGRREAGRVVFLYPTRGTATEGFRDYVGWAPETKAALVHGTAGYELDAMRTNPSEATDGKHYVEESAARLFALGLWSKRYFSATVDQFLGFVEHSYQSLCLLPVLADAVVVLDEVHSYDRRLFENAASFLKAFDVPVLAMTATLPKARRDRLEALGLTQYPRAEHRAQLADLEEQERHARYQVEACASEDAALAACIDELGRGRRVLWVVNTVARAQRLARRFAEGLCYHSRFKLEDRQRAHQATVEQFKTSTHAVIAVTTQVCEMSLDLDADVLITELAPWPSIVQRMGRANRHRRHGDAFRARVILYEPERVLPYSRDELATARQAVTELQAAGGAVAQRTLADLLERFSTAEALRTDAGLFLNSGWYAVPGSLRDEDDFTRPCVLDAEISSVVRCLAEKRPIDGFVVPVPAKSLIPDAERPGLPPWLGVARADQYDARLGFMADTEGS